MGFIASLNQTLVLFLLILVGYIARRLDVFDDILNKGISNLVLYITLPALIIKSMQFEFSKDLLIKSGQILLISVLFYAVAIILSYIIVRLLKTSGIQKDVFQFMLIFSNVGYMGHPVVYAIYGELGVFYAAIMNITFNLLLWTVGIYVITRNSGKTHGSINYKEVLRNPGIIAVFIGFAFFLFSIKLPRFIFDTLDMLGNATTPLSMMVIGAILGDIAIREIFNDYKILWISIARLIVIPGVIMSILMIMKFNGLLLGVPVIIAAMPAAANTAVFATLYDSDYYLASKGVFVTTFLSIITIPLFTLILK